jgi:hypothetical protein
MKTGRHYSIGWQYKSPRACQLQVYVLTFTFPPLNPNIAAEGWNDFHFKFPSLNPSGKAFPLSSIQRYIYFEHDLPVWPIYINRVSGACRSLI